MISDHCALERVETSSNRLTIQPGSIPGLGRQIGPVWALTNQHRTRVTTWVETPHCEATFAARRSESRRTRSDPRDEDPERGKRDSRRDGTNFQHQTTMNEKQTKHYAKMAKQFQPKTKKPVDKAKLRGFKDGFETVITIKRIAVSQRKKALARNPVKVGAR